MLSEWDHDLLQAWKLEVFLQLPHCAAIYFRSAWTLSLHCRYMEALDKAKIKRQNVILDVAEQKKKLFAQDNGRFEIQNKDRLWLTPLHEKAALHFLAQLHSLLPSAPSISQCYLTDAMLMFVKMAAFLILYWYHVFFALCFFIKMNQFEADFKFLTARFPSQTKLILNKFFQGYLNKRSIFSSSMILTHWDFLKYEYNVLWINLCWYVFFSRIFWGWFYSENRIAYFIWNTTNEVHV